MTDKNRQSGRPSRLGIAKQSGEGTYAAPTNIFNATAWDFPDNANLQKYAELAGQLDSIVEAQRGIPEITGTMTGGLRAFQGIMLIKAYLGGDTLSGADDVVIPNALASLAAGATSATVTSVPATPAGIADWIGAVLTVSDGTHTEKVPILAASGTTVNFAALKNAYSGTITLTIKKQHCVQPLAFPNAANLDFMSACAQWGDDSELQIQDLQLFGMTLRNNGMNIEAAYTAVVNAMYAYDGDVTTTITAATGELTDRPMTLREARAFSYGQASDTVMVEHKRISALSLASQIADQKLAEAGQSVQQHVAGDRTHTLTWTESSGEAAFKTFHNDFVTNYRETPFLFYFGNSSVGTNGVAVSVYAPRCAIDQYVRQGPGSNVIARNGQATPMVDAQSTGIALRIWIDHTGLGSVAQL